MNAELVAIGSELLGPLRAETNTLWITEQLLEAGVSVAARVTVADELPLIASAFRAALGRADVVIATGGLGPTADDLTREAAAAATGRELRRDPQILARLRERFAHYGRTMSDTNAKQADLVAGAAPLANPRGTAPGQRIEVDGRHLFLLPGPPGEMRPMFEAEVLPRLRAALGPTAVVRRRVLRIASMPEGEVDQVIAPVYSRFDNPKTTILGSPGQVELHLVARGKDADQAEAAIARLGDALHEALPGRIYSEDGRDLPAVVLDLMVARGLTLALAESCTGGLLASRLTEVPGSSRVLERGYVTYSNRAKTEDLGVPPALLEEVGAVSEPVAAAMAEGARARASASIGVGITGIAGPDGGTPEKPVGLVFVAISGAAGSAWRRCLFPGSRGRIRYQASQYALEMLRGGLLGLPLP
ncbi:MAG TPA: competence/damage-inducible protein A [Vicinamibacteria bacterium]|nr:competence/damage-inducible protein A [Vicinamibacteria bacterium]